MPGRAHGRGTTRRAFLRRLLGAACLLGAGPGAWAYGLRPYFTWAQLRYPGTWDPNPRAAGRFLRALRRRTSVEPARSRRIVDPADPGLFRLPFLYVAGRGRLPDLGGGGRGGPAAVPGARGHGAL